MPLRPKKKPKKTVRDYGWTEAKDRQVANLQESISVGDRSNQKKEMQRLSYQKAKAEAMLKAGKPLTDKQLEGRGLPKNPSRLSPAAEKYGRESLKKSKAKSAAKATVGSAVQRAGAAYRSDGGKTGGKRFRSREK